MYTAPKGVTAMIPDYLHDSSTAEAAMRFRVVVLAATLRNVQGIAHVILDGLGKRAQILTARTYPDHRL